MKKIVAILAIAGAAGFVAAQPPPPGPPSVAATLKGGYERIKTNFNPRLEIQGVVLTMFDKRNNLSDQVAADVRGYLGEKVYQTVIPRNVRMSEAPSFGKPALLYDHRCAGSKAYISLARELLRRETELRAA